MLIGAWKSFVDLEDSLTLDELFALYESQLAREHEEFRRMAGLQGVEVPDLDEEDEQEEAPPQRETLKQRVARRRAEERGENPEQAANEAMFEGVGYKLIGG